MTSKDSYKSIGNILITDSTITNYISNRVLAEYSISAGILTPAITLCLEDTGIISDLPAGTYRFTVGIWNSIDKANAIMNMQDIKDRIKTLLNKKPAIINAQGYSTKFRTFDLVSAIISDEYLGSKKLWYMPCIFDCIIGD